MLAPICRSLDFFHQRKMLVAKIPKHTFELFFWTLGLDGKSGAKGIGKDDEIDGDDEGA